MFTSLNSGTEMSSTIRKNQKRPVGTRRFSYQSGQAAVVMTIAMAGLLAAIAMCADVGVMYVNWLNLQRAADGAALAGAQYLPNDSADAITTATAYVQKNGSSSTEIVGGAATVAADELSITVHLQRTVPYYFGRVLGLSSQLIQVSATAGVQQNPGDAKGLLPVGLGCAPGSCSYQKNTTYQLKSGQVGPGNWGALALGGNGSDIYRGNLETGYQGTISVGDTVSSEPGNVVGPTGQGVADRIAAGQAIDPSADANNPPSYDPRMVVFPELNLSTSKGKSTITVVGFAQMWLVGTENNNNTIDAIYLGDVSTSGSSAITNFGIVTPVLIR